jgi:hypothetical protein
MSWRRKRRRLTGLGRRPSARWDESGRRIEESLALEPRRSGRVEKRALLLGVFSPTGSVEARGPDAAASAPDSGLRGHRRALLSARGARPQRLDRAEALYQGLRGGRAIRKAMLALMRATRRPRRAAFERPTRAGTRSDPGRAALYLGILASPRRGRGRGPPVERGCEIRLRRD